MKITKICCIGAGYVGGPTMSVIAQKCPHIQVMVVDSNKDRIKSWNNSDLSQLPIYEPGLAEVVNEARGRNLFFSTNVHKAIEESQIIFIAVNTPTKTYGVGAGMASDLTYVQKCARQIAEVSSTDKIVIEKSTLPVRTAEAVKKILYSSNNGNKFEVLSNPEFLAEGTAVQDLSKSDRVLIGGDETKSGKRAINILVEIYSNWIPKDKIITTNLWSAELSKLVSNAFLAQRISSINSISALCEKTGADVSEVANAVGKDSRIGPKFLNSSIGFGGSCFQKDILNLVYLSEYYGLNEVAKYWNGVVEINNYQKDRFTNKIIHSLFNSVNEKKIALFGWAFKKDTNDSRESAAIYISNKLLNEGAIINIYDPQISLDKIKLDLLTLCEALGEKKSFINDKLNRVNSFRDSIECCVGTEAVAILTEWDEFKKINFKKVFDVMIKPAFIFDGRKILNKERLEDIGFNSFEIGKSDLF